MQASGHVSHAEDDPSHAAPRLFFSTMCQIRSIRPMMLAFDVCQIVTMMLRNDVLT